MTTISLETSSAGSRLERELRHFCMQSAPNQAILPERKLAKKYDISHGTVRRVLSTLMEEGLIYKVHGRGTFVAEATRATVDQSSLTIIYADSWGNLCHPHYARRLEGLSAAAVDSNLRLEVLYCGHHMERREHLAAELLRPQVAGLIAPWMTEESFTGFKRVNPRLQVVTTASFDPASGTCAVGIDYRWMGSTGWRYLIEQGSRRPLFVYQTAEARFGVESITDTAIDPLFLRVRAGETRVDPILSMIHDQKPDALLFDDDVVARSTLLALGRPGFPVASHHNVGDQQMPEWVAKLQIDGLIVGRLIMRSLRAMIDGDPLQDTSIRVRPKLIEPS